MTIRVMNEDCLTAMAKLDAGSVDLTVTSPPYDDLLSYNGMKDWSQEKWESVLTEIFRVTTLGGALVWVTADATKNGSESGNSFRQALFAISIGFRLHDTMIWEKSTFSAVGALASRYAPVFEYMFVFSKGKPKTFNPIKDRPNIHAGVKVHGTVRNFDGSTKPVHDKEKVIGDFGQRFNVWRINEEKVLNKTHPAVYPVSLVQDHILSWSNPNDIVFDPFMGSGTTGVACQKTGRNFIGVERDPVYFRDACFRLIGIPGINAKELGL